MLTISDTIGASDSLTTYGVVVNESEAPVGSELSAYLMNVYEQFVFQSKVSLHWTHLPLLD